MQNNQDITSAKYSEGVAYYNNGQMLQSIDCFQEIIRSIFQIENPDEAFINHFGNSLNYIRMISLCVKSDLEKEISAIQDEFMIHSKKIEEFSNTPKGNMHLTYKELCDDTANWSTPFIDVLKRDIELYDTNHFRNYLIGGGLIAASVASIAYLYLKRKNSSEESKPEQQ